MLVKYITTMLADSSRSVTNAISPILTNCDTNELSEQPQIFSSKSKMPRMYIE